MYDELDAEEDGVDFEPSLCARNFPRGKYIVGYTYEINFIVHSYAMFSVLYFQNVNVALIAWLDGIEMLAIHFYDLLRAPIWLSF